MLLNPVFHGRNGHPTLFPRSLLKEINTDTSLRGVIGRHAGRVSFHPVEDEGVVLDMDTPADYRRMLQKCRPARREKLSDAPA